MSLLKSNKPSTNSFTWALGHKGTTAVSQSKHLARSQPQTRATLQLQAHTNPPSPHTLPNCLHLLITVHGLFRVSCAHQMLQFFFIPTAAVEQATYYSHQGDAPSSLLLIVSCSIHSGQKVLYTRAHSHSHPPTHTYVSLIC